MFLRENGREEEAIISIKHSKENEVNKLSKQLSTPSATVQYHGRDKVQYKQASEKVPLEDL